MCPPACGLPGAAHLRPPTAWRRSLSSLDLMTHNDRHITPAALANFRAGREPWGQDQMSKRFYEKVVKVKADVAAILKFFFRSNPTDRGRPIWTRPRWRPSGGCARGVSAERFETPLAGGAAASMCASAVCWRIACQRVGGTRPPRLSPGGGNGKGGDQTSLLPLAVRACIAPMAG